MSWQEQQKMDEDLRYREIVEALTVCRRKGVPDYFIRVLETETGVKLKQEQPCESEK